MDTTGLALGERFFDITDRALVMGILNRTPDSFYDRGATYALDDLLRRAEGLVADGADILDVGGVKAGPGPAVGEDEELDRVIPALTALRSRLDTPVVRRHLEGIGGPGGLCGRRGDGKRHQRLLGPRLPAGRRGRRGHRGGHPHPARSPHPRPRACLRRRGGVRPLLPPRAGVAGESPRSPIRSDRPRRRTRPRQDRHPVVDPAAGPGPVGVLGYPLLLSASNKTFLGKVLGLEIGERRRRHWPPPPWASRWAAGSCGSTTWPPIARCAEALGRRQCRSPVHPAVTG